MHERYEVGAGKLDSEGCNPEFDNEHGQASALLPVLPLSLGYMACSEVQDLLLKLKSRLTRSFPQDFSGIVCEQHKELRKSMQNHPLFRKELADGASTAVILEGFNTSWRPQDSAPAGVLLVKSIHI